jgi:hypothetical protein
MAKVSKEAKAQESLAALHLQSKKAQLHGKR